MLEIHYQKFIIIFGAHQEPQKSCPILYSYRSVMGLKMLENDRNIEFGIQWINIFYPHHLKTKLKMINI